MKPNASKTAVISGNIFKIFAVATVGLAFLATEPAMAAGKGKDKGSKSNSKAKGKSKSKSKSKSKGKVASELKGLNAAHAKIAAMLNASPESMPGKLAVYVNEYKIAMSDLQDAMNTLAKKQFAYDLAEATLLEAQKTVSGMSEGDSGYDAAVKALNTAQESFDEAYKELETAKANYASVQEAAQTDITNALYALTDGRQLSSAAIKEMHKLLGLA